MADFKLEGFITTEIPLNDQYKKEWEKGYELIDSAGNRSILLENKEERLLIDTSIYDGSSSVVYGTGDPIKYKNRRKFTDNRGYLQIEYPEHPRARYSKGEAYIKTVPEHVLVAEDNIGRQLRRYEVVHHLDQDKENNSPNNLLILSSNEHSRIHKWLEGLVISYNELGLLRREKKSNRCKNCTKPTNIGKVYCSAVCSEDYNGVEQEYTEIGERLRELSISGYTDSSEFIALTEKAHSSKTKSLNKPDRETLLKEVEIIPFTELGKKYGVSDNGVRKWCKNYGIEIPKRLGHWAKVQYGHLPDPGSVYIH